MAWPGGTIDAMLPESTKPQDTGIGLYVVKTAVENHRAAITIGRSPLGAAEFRIWFLREADPPISTDATPAGPVAHPEPSTS